MEKTAEVVGCDSGAVDDDGFDLREEVEAIPAKVALLEAAPWAGIAVRVVELTHVVPTSAIILLDDLLPTSVLLTFTWP